MPCQGFTKSGAPCRNQASANGYCHLHGGIPTRRAARREAARYYASLTPEQRAEHDRNARGCTPAFILLCILGAILYAAATGDTEGAVRWLTH